MTVFEKNVYEKAYKLTNRLGVKLFFCRTSYEVVLNDSDVTDEDIIYTACNLFRINVKQDTRYYMPWPPNLSDLCNENQSVPVMIKLFRYLTKTNLGSKMMQRYVFE